MPSGEGCDFCERGARLQEVVPHWASILSCLFTADKGCIGSDGDRVNRERCVKVSADWQFKMIQIDSLNRFESIQYDQILTRLPDQNLLSETRNSPG